LQLTPRQGAPPTKIALVYRLTTPEVGASLCAASLVLGRVSLAKWLLTRSTATRGLPQLEEG